MSDVIRPNFSACQLDVKERTLPSCAHRRLAVDEHSVECTDCKVPLNPIAVLHDFAQRERRLRWWEAEHARLAKEIDAMKKELTRLKRAVREHKEIPR